MLLFGAGAETEYHLPTGAEYTKNTILTKKIDLYNALVDFYRNRTSDAFSGSYSSEYLFQANSHALYELIDNAARVLKDKIQSGKVRLAASDYSRSVVELLDAPDYPTELKNYIRNKDNFKNLVRENEDPISESPYKALEQEYGYYGTIEKDFSCIINPKKAGPNRFWRLINYFWSAFFSIMVPILKHSYKYNKKVYTNNKIDYEYILNNLQDILFDIYSDSFIGEYEVAEDKDYYKKFNELLQPDYVATSNYTPFVKKLLSDNNKIAFLAGELSVFEKPQKLEVYNIIKQGINDEDLIFPFIMTQAPIKPIISTYQLEEYSKFLRFINATDIIVIVGFSLSENDNHINALLHDAVLSGKKIIYCAYYTGKGFDANSVKEKICDSLHLDEISERVLVIQNDGNIAKLIERIKLEL